MVVLNHGKLRFEVRTACLAGWSKKKLAELLASKYEQPETSESEAEEYFLGKINSHLAEISGTLKLAKQLGNVNAIREAEETKKLCTFAGGGRGKRKMTPMEKLLAKLDKNREANDNAGRQIARLQEEVTAKQLATVSSDSVTTADSGTMAS